MLQINCNYFFTTNSNSVLSNSNSNKKSKNARNKRRRQQAKRKKAKDVQIEPIHLSCNQFDCTINESQVQQIITILNSQSQNDQNTIIAKKTDCKNKIQQITKVINYTSTITNGLNNQSKNSVCSSSMVSFQENQFKAQLHDVITFIKSETNVHNNDLNWYQLMLLSQQLIKFLPSIQTNTIKCSNRCQHLILETISLCCKVSQDCSIHIVQSESILFILNVACEKLFGTVDYSKQIQTKHNNNNSNNNNNNNNKNNSNDCCNLSHIISLHQHQTIIEQTFKILTTLFNHISTVSQCSLRWITIFRYLCQSKFFHRIVKLFSNIVNENLVSVSQYYFILNSILPFCERISRFVQLSMIHHQYKNE